MLKLLADEAEGDGKIQTATTLYKENLTKHSDNLQIWFDYGAFCMRNNMQSTGEECFREILSINPEHFLTYFFLLNTSY